MTIKAKRKSGLAHCCHHDIHWEFCFDYQARVDFIKNHKPQGEQELRLTLFQIIPDELLPGKGSPEWKAYEQAGIAYEKAWKSYDETGIAYYEAWAAYEQARGKELAELHDEMFPDCPWDGHTIFKG